MAQAGIIKTITGIVNVRTPDGQVRQLMTGDMVYENEIIETTTGSQITIELSNGKTLALTENSQLVLDETVIAVVDAQDAVVLEAQELQAALEAGEDITGEEEPAAGPEDEDHDYDLAYYAGDQSRGEVGSELFGTEYGGDDEDFPDVEGEEEGPITSTEEEADPLFIVGSNPDNERLDQDQSYEIEEDIYRDDVENFVEIDTHTVPSPTGVNQGAILGQGGADILVGDPGSVNLYGISSNYIMVIDYSHSVYDSSSLVNLLNATKDTILTLYDRIERGTNGSEVRINLLPFAGDADSINHSAWISFRNDNGTVVIENSINPGVTDTIDEIMTWIDGSTASIELGEIGLTNYFAAFTEAQNIIGISNPSNANYNQDNVIFISDGSPNAGGPYLDAHSVLYGLVDSIRAVGINMGGRTVPTMDALDTEGPAANIDSTQLSDVIIDLIPQEVQLNPTGSDEIEGNDGNDLIFGDVLNTDGVFESLQNEGYDLSGIENLPDGSGWEVFAQLEASNPDLWTREETIQYIQDNHKDLAGETVINGQGRYGGNDIIEGGDGNDIIYGQEGNDWIDGGSGFNTIDGGTGLDTLMIGNDSSLNFANISNIEKIHLNADGPDQNLTISLNDVLSMTEDNMTGNNILQISGEDGDSVTLTGVGTNTDQWTQDSTNLGLFTHNDTGDQVTIASLNDGVDIEVEVGIGGADGASFDV